MGNPERKGMCGCRSITVASILTSANVFVEKTSLQFVSLAQNMGGCLESHLLLHLFIIKTEIVCKNSFIFIYM